MASSLLSVPPPSPPQRRPHPFPIKPPPPTLNSNRKPYISSPPSSSSAPEEDSASSSIILDDLQFRGCKTCGKEEIEKGCNGEGRIQGGIATVPGFGWWPIKAFRPCPGFVAAGGRYKRRGQSMDEVAFGRGGRDVAGS